MKSVRSKNIFKRCLAAFCAVILISSVCFSIDVFAADSIEQDKQHAEELQQRIANANNEIERLGKESKESNEYLKAVNAKIALVQGEVDELNKKIDPLKKEIKSLEEKIQDSSNQIAEIEQQLPELDEKFDNCFEEYGKRMRALYITGNVTNLELIITSKDVSSMLTRAEMIKGVSKKDADALNELTDTMKEIKEKREKIEAEKTSLETNRVTMLASKSQLDEALAQVNEKKATLMADKSQVNETVKKLAKETGEHTDAISEDREELEKIDRDIKAAIAKAEKEAAENATTAPPPLTTTGVNGETDPPTAPPVTKPPTTGTGVFTIPCPNYRNISARFPTYSSGSYHSGLDFAANTGTSIVAADSGVVIISEDLKNSDGSYRSYGKYIIIRHKAGLYTLYAHTSERLVSVGQSVEKGQQIAKVGETGNATGPHLHFEVRTGSGGYSDCVNPELSQYLGSVPYSR